MGFMQYIMVYSISHKDLHIVFFKVFLQSMLEGALFIYIIRNQRMKLFIIKKEISILVYSGTIKTLRIRVNQIKIPVTIVDFNNDILNIHLARITPIYRVI